MKTKHPGGTAPKDFLVRAQLEKRGAEAVRRDNLKRLVGTRRFPQFVDLAKALGYSQSRISHLKNGLKGITPELARGIEAQLGLKPGYFDQEHTEILGRAPDMAANHPAAQDAVSRYLAKEKPAKELALELGVSESSLYKWVAETKQLGKPQTRESLEEENQRLKNKLLELMLEGRG